VEPGQHELKIILIRHGETEANRKRCFAESSEIPLTDAGRHQARALASYLAANFQPGVLLSSEFLRAWQTSEIIADALHLKAEVIAGIHERDFGCLKGLPYSGLGEMMLLNAAVPWMWSPPGGESLHQVQQRAVAAIELLRVRYPEQEVVLVSHGAVIQAICAHITGEWTEASVPPNCGIVVIEYDAQKWKQPVRTGGWECY
jgi:broad specificity phosphatase PhoE